jgi:hypothetical protein
MHDATAQAQDSARPEAGLNGASKMKNQNNQGFTSYNWLRGVSTRTLSPALRVITQAQDTLPSRSENLILLTVLNFLTQEGQSWPIAVK